DDEEVRALLEFRAAKEPRIVQAFVNRERNPQAWATVQKTLTRELADRASRKPDRNLTKGRQAAEAAARGISTTAPSTDSKVPPQSELSKMSDADFNKLIGELGA